MTPSHDADVSAPRHERLYRDLRAAIEAGAYQVGEMMPTEATLCARHAVSRYTLREALKRLEADGFISRRRGSGTRVAALTRRTPVFKQVIGSEKELELFARGTRIAFDAPALVETDTALARTLGCDELRRWHRLSGVRYDGERPFGVTTLYLDAARVAAPDPAAFGQDPVYRWMERAAGLTLCGISQDIVAVSLPETCAAIFDEQAGAPALQITRRYFDESNRLFEIALNIHRSTDFVHNMQIRLDV
ncbi:MAG: GntR family transcriptional regulator [Caulobacterales bacterium]|nr:GntR family transcriptional regulator [Caulobacterales bacterium]